MPSAQLRLSVAVEHTLGKVRKQRHASGLQQVQDELGDHQFGLGFAGLRVGGRSGFGSSFGAFGFGRLLPFFPDLRLLFEASSIPAPSTSRERLTPINASRIELSETFVTQLRSCHSVPKDRCAKPFKLLPYLLLQIEHAVGMSLC
jgi:hypothetical protein